MANVCRHAALLFLCAPVLGSELKLATFDGAKGTTVTWMDQNDPVMGGGSTSSFNVTADKTGLFSGTCAIVGYLKAPGFAKIHGSGNFPDITDYDNIAVRVKSSTPDYKGFKVAFSAPGVPKGSFYGGSSYKADLKLTSGGWQVIEIPLTQFSYDWSAFTGRCDTKDPALGLWKQHYCCSKSGLQPSKPDVCVNSKFLSKVNQFELWAEGVQGAFNLEIEWIGATKNSNESASRSVAAPAAPPGQFDTCKGSVQAGLRYGISGRTTPDIPVPVDENESLAEAVCCDSRTKVFAEPQFLYQAPDISLYSKMGEGVTTFYDSVCGVPLFRAPVNRSLAEFKADTDEHGWPSFRPAEVVTEHVHFDKDGFTYSSCGTHLGSYLPDAKGPRWCMDLSCIAGNPKDDGPVLVV